MSKTKFTPGPCKPFFDKGEEAALSWQVRDRNGYTHAYCSSESKARLFAAAPEMYRLLEEELEYKRALEKERYGDGAVDPWPEWTELLARIRGEEMS